MRRIALVSLGAGAGTGVADILALQKFDVTVGAAPDLEALAPAADVVVIDGGEAAPDDLDRAVDAASAQGAASVLAIFELPRGVPFRVRREALLALGASDVMQARAPADELVTRVRALLLRDASPRILVIEDDPKIAAWMADALDAIGMTPIRAGSVADARAAFAAGPVDAIVTDRMLPDGDGLDFVRMLRGQGIRLPVLVHTALTDLSDRLAGLTDAGADDYLCKPAHGAELCARLQVLLRPRETDDTLRFGPLELARRDRLVRWRGRRIDLRPREVDLLIYLAERAPLPIPQQMLYLDVWERSYMEPGSNPVSAVKHRLTQGFARALEDMGETAPRFILADGAGYVFDPEPLLRLDEGAAAP